MKQKQKIQINISEIENGFLLGLPPEQHNIIAAAQMGQQAQPRVQFCENLEAVIVSLKEVWPSDLRD